MTKMKCGVGTTLICEVQHYKQNFINLLKQPLVTF